MSSENRPDESLVDSALAELAVDESPKTLEQLAADLGPYEPPSEFDHGQEFDADLPRRIPKILRRGSFSRRRRSTPIVLAALGASFAIVAPWTIIEKLSFYVLPLAYLGEIGYLLIAIAAFLLLRNWWSKGKFEYVRTGIPFIGRVLSVGRSYTQTVNPENTQITTTVRPLVAFEFDHPETKSHEYSYYHGDITWNQSADSHYTMNIAPGDYVTLVAIPDKFAQSLAVYGFLGLDPNREYLSYKMKPLQGISPFSAILIASLVFCGLWMLVGFLYLVTYCIPAEWSWSLGAPALAVGLAVGATLGWQLGRYNQSQGNAASPGGMAFCLGLFGAFGGFLGLGLINALFDHSAPTYLPIEINKHWQTTHNFVLRHYDIEYTELGQVKSEKSQVTFEDLGRIGPAKLGAKEIRSGALGLDWVAGFHPCEWVNLGDDATELDKQRAVTVDTKKWVQSELLARNFPMDVDEFLKTVGNDSETTDIVPMLIVDDHKRVSAPEALIARMKQQIQNQIK